MNSYCSIYGPNHWLSWRSTTWYSRETIDFSRTSPLWSAGQTKLKAENRTRQKVFTQKVFTAYGMALHLAVYSLVGPLQGIETHIWFYLFHTVGKGASLYKSEGGCSNVSLSESSRYNSVSIMSRAQGSSFSDSSLTLCNSLCLLFSVPELAMCVDIHPCVTCMNVHPFDVYS